MAFQQRLNGLGESQYVRVIALQDQFAPLADQLDDIHGTDTGGILVQFVKIRNDLFLVGDGDIQSHQVRMGGDDLGEILNGRNLKVDIFRVNVLRMELLVEEVLGEGVAERIADQTKLFHGDVSF